MGRGILRGAGGDENLKSNFIWPKVPDSNDKSMIFSELLKKAILS